MGIENNNIILKLNGKRGFTRDLLKVAIPVIMQQLIIVALNLADTVMVGNISEKALAAVGAANQIYFIYIDCIFGFLSGAAVFAVQYWGIGDLKTLRKTMGISYTTVIAISIPSMIIAYVWAPQLIEIFASDVDVIKAGTEYMRIACFTYLFAGLTFVISYFSRATMLLKWPTIINAVAVTINIVLNYGMIYGKLGFTRMEVRGAAWATLIARIVEFSAVLIYVYVSKSHPLKSKIREMIFDKNLYINVMKTAVPVSLNEVMWVLSFTVVFAIYGRLGATAFAVVQVAMTISDLFQTMYIGLCNGCNVIVGQKLGQGKRDEAFDNSKTILKMTWIMNITLTLLLLLLRGVVAGIYDFNPVTTSLLMDTLAVYALAMAPKMLAYVFICGIFRPGGDTFWCFIVDGGLNWFLNVPLAYIAVEVLHLSLPLCVGFVALAEVVKTVICYFRFYGKKWINVFTGR